MIYSAGFDRCYLYKEEGVSWGEADAFLFNKVLAIKY